MDIRRALRLLYPISPRFTQFRDRRRVLRFEFPVADSVGTIERVSVTVAASGFSLSVFQ